MSPDDLFAAIIRTIAAVLWARVMIRYLTRGPRPELQVGGMVLLYVLAVIAISGWAVPLDLAPTWVLRILATSGGVLAIAAAILPARRS